MNKILMLILMLLVSSNSYAGLDFDGSDDYLSCGNVGLPTTFPISVYASVNPNTFTNSASQVVFNWSDISDADEDIVLGFHGDTASELRTRFRVRTNGDIASLDGTTNRHNDTYGALVGVAASLTDKELFYNGDSQVTITTSEGFPTNLDTSAIGVYCRNSGCTTDESAGVIYEVAVWDVALTDEEVQVVSKGRQKGIALQVQPDNLVSYWLLNEVEDGASASGSTMVDIISGNDCSVNSAPVGYAEDKMSYY